MIAADEDIVLVAGKGNRLSGSCPQSSSRGRVVVVVRVLAVQSWRLRHRCVWRPRLRSRLSSGRSCSHGVRMKVHMCFFLEHVFGLPILVLLRF